MLVALETSDGYELEVEEESAIKSEYLKHIIEESLQYVGSEIPGSENIVRVHDPVKLLHPSCTIDIVKLIFDWTRNQKLICCSGEKKADVIIAAGFLDIQPLLKFLALCWDYLEIAVQQENQWRMHPLYEKAVCVNSFRYTTVLHLATARGHLEAVKHILEFAKKPFIDMFDYVSFRILLVDKA